MESRLPAAYRLGDGVCADKVAADKVAAAKAQVMAKNIKIGRMIEIYLTFC